MPRSKTLTPSVTLQWRAGIAYASWSVDRISKRKALRDANNKPIRDKEQAKRALAQFAAERLRPDAARKAAHTIGDLLDLYLDDRRGRVASHATLEHCCAALRRHMGDLAPLAITVDVCRDYAARRHAEGRRGIKRDGRPISDGTIIRELVTLRSALKGAKGRGLIAEVPRIEVPRKPPSRERWMTRDEADTLLQKCNTPHVKLFIVLALNTAARAGAILALKWDAVNLESGWVDYGAAVGNKRKGRVPLNATAKAALLAAQSFRETEYVIEFHGKPLKSIKRGIALATKAAGIGGVTAHIFRHTAATWMVQRGIPLAEVARFLHDSEAMIEKVYGHHSPEWLANAARALED